jgi:nitroreductase
MSTSLFDLMRSRRSIRAYAGDPIPAETLALLEEAASLAPTSRDRKPCRFYTVTDKAQLAQLAKAKAAGSAFTAQAAAAIVVAADSTVSDTWIEDSSIAMTYMMLAAEALGLGCCWVQMHLRSDENGISAEENVRHILALPEQFRVVGFLALGQKEVTP